MRIFFERYRPTFERMIAADDCTLDYPISLEDSNLSKEMGRIMDLGGWGSFHEGIGKSVRASPSFL